MNVYIGLLQATPSGSTGLDGPRKLVGARIRVGLGPGLGYVILRGSKFFAVRQIQLIPPSCLRIYESSHL